MNKKKNLFEGKEYTIGIENFALASWIGEGSGVNMVYKFVGKEAGFVFEPTGIMYMKWNLGFIYV